MIRVQSWNEFISPKFYGPLAIWPWLKISPQSSLNIIYCFIIAAWQWLMSFMYTPCIPMQIKPNKSPWGTGSLLVLLLWEIGYLSSPSRSCLRTLILIRGSVGGPHNNTKNISSSQGELSFSFWLSKAWKYIYKVKVKYIYFKTFP